MYMCALKRTCMFMYVQVTVIDQLIRSGGISTGHEWGILHGLCLEIL